VSRRRAGGAGFSLLELMVTMALVGLTMAFVFRIFASSSVSFRAQSRIADIQQSLRSARSLLAEDLRMAGYMSRQLITRVDATSSGFAGAGSVHPATGTAIGFWMRAVAIQNSSTGPDAIRVVYADGSCSSPTLAPSNASQVTVASVACFKVGMVVAASYIGQKATRPAAAGCVLQVTSIDPINNRLTFAGGNIWNSTGNPHCGDMNLPGDWTTDGKMAIYPLVMHAYRIKPADARGVLQRSLTGGLSNDWEDIAFGFTDLQLAARVAMDTDADGTADDAFEWRSGENMESPTLSGASSALVSLRFSLVGRAATDGVMAATTPSLLGEGDADNNPLGDHDAEVIADITDPVSPVRGEFVFRFISTVVDLRNIGTGLLEPA
jgi:prepilin-type N-terminal cleavage/methylation domain-containing protein